MGSMIQDISKLLNEINDPERQDRRASTLARRCLLEARVALAAKNEFGQIHEEIFLAETNSVPALAERFRERAKMTHYERCRALRDLAYTTRLLLRIASADLRLDAETSGTGLSSSDLSMISEVCGKDELSGL